MQIKDFKDLEKVIKLARKTGVQSIKIDNVELHLGAEPTKAITYKPAAITLESPDPLAHARVPGYTPYVPVVATDIHSPDELTEEQLMFYSSDEQQS